MNFRLKNFKKAKQAQATQDQAAQTPDANAAQNVLNQADLDQIAASHAEVQAEQADAIAQVLAESAAAKIAEPAGDITLLPEHQAIIAAYMEQEKKARIERMHKAKAEKAAKRKAEAEAAEAAAKQQAELQAKAKVAAEQLAKAQAEAKEKAKAEARKAEKANLEKLRDKLAEEAAIKDLQAEIAALQAKVGKAQVQAQATKEPTKTVIQERKPKLYDDNFLVAMRKQELLKAAKAPTSKSVRMYVLVNGQKVSMKDAFRAFTGSKATNDELDSSAIARFFDKHGIAYVRES